MPTFLYKGISKDGTKVGGSKSFNSKDEMKKFVETLDLYNTEIFESKTKYNTKLYKSVNQKELSLFCKQMSVLFFSHITFMEGIQMLGDQSNNKELKIALNEIYEIMDKGYTFAETFAMYDHIFGKYLINMVFIGESSGTLDSIFSDMSIYYEKENKVQKKIRSAVTYPIVLSVIMFAIIIFLVKSILPMFDSMLMSMGAESSLLTESIIAVANFLNVYGIIFILIIVLIIIAMKFYGKTEKGKFAFDKAKMTVSGLKYINSRIVTARFSRSMAILIKSGTQVVSAIDQSIVLLNNVYLKEKFIIAYEKVKAGESLSYALNEIGVFPELFIKMTIIGERTGNLDAMLDKSSQVFQEEVDDSIDKMTGLIEPVLITILSLIVGAILLAIMLPMIEIMQYI